MVIATAINESRKAAEADVNAMQRRWAAEEWAAAKRQFMEHLGHRSGHWDGGRETAQLTKAVLGDEFVGALASPAAPVETFVLAHANIVAHIADSISRNATADLRPANAFANAFEVPDVGAVAANSDAQLSRSELQLYKNLLGILEEIGGEHKIGSKGNPKRPGSYASLCFPESTLLDKSRQTALRVHVTETVKTNLESHKWESLNKLMEDLASKGLLAFFPTVGGRVKRSRIATYAAYLLQNSQLPPVRNTTLAPMSTGNLRVPLWPYVYFCVRIGDLDGALIELKNQQNVAPEAVTGAVIVCLSAIPDITAGTLRDKADGATRGAQYMNQAGILRKAYNDEISRNDADPYKLALLNLLSLAEQDFSLYNADIRDFLWQNLWFEHLTEAFTHNGISMEIANLQGMAVTASSHTT